MPWKSKYECGQKFNKWTLVSRDLSQKRPAKWVAKCECGNEVLQVLSNITSSKSTQCSKCADIQRSKRSNESMIGNKFNSLLVLDLEKKNGKMLCKVQCDCGEIKFVRPFGLKNGLWKTCGRCKHFKGLRVGTKKDSLVIIKEINKNTSLARCVCGIELEVKKYHLTVKHASCGCYWKNIKIEKAKKVVGLKWGNLKCVKFLGMLGEEKKTRAHYLLKCKCGNEIVKDIGHLFEIKSCGCMHKESSAKGSKNYNAKTNESEVKTIRELFESKLYTRKELSSMTGLKYEHICILINSKKSWKHLK